MRGKGLYLPCHHEQQSRAWVDSEMQDVGGHFVRVAVTHPNGVGGVGVPQLLVGPASLIADLRGVCAFGATDLVALSDVELSGGMASAAPPHRE